MRTSSISLSDARTAVGVRLRARADEIVQAVLARVTSVTDPSDKEDLEYVEGLRAAVPAALEYGIAAVEGANAHPPIPPGLRAQARLAARNGISLDTVLRRYVAGYALLGDFVIEEAEKDGLGAATLQCMMREQASGLDRLLTVVTEEYAREASECATVAQRRVQKIQRLLAGELLDTTDISYGFDAFHVGAMAGGSWAEEAIRDLAATFDCRLLLIRRGEEDVVSAWFGTRRRLGPVELEEAAASCWPARTALAIGEPGRGLDGWRLTHRQARAAWPIAQRGGGRLTRYADVALVASVLQDDLLAASLNDLYLAPLAEERDGGETLRQTLRAYLAAERNASSAAALLGVSRRTVTNRLRAVEARVGRSLSSVVTEIDTALRLDDLGRLS